MKIPKKGETFSFFGMTWRYSSLGLNLGEKRVQDSQFEITRPCGEPRLRGAYGRTARRPQYFPNTFVLHLFFQFCDAHPFEPAHLGSYTFFSDTVSELKLGQNCIG